jgi:16S rRNA processing protein RimM
MSENRILIGEITTVHGIKGYVKVRSYVDDESLLEGNNVYTSEAANDTIKLTLKNALKGDWVAQVSGIHDRNLAETLRGTQLYVDRAALPDAGDDEFYIEDLKGLGVVDANGNTVGTVDDVVNFGAGDLLDIKPTAGQNFYLSFQDETILNIDMDEKTITVALPEVV